MDKTIVIIERNAESVTFYKSFLSQNGFIVEQIATDIQLLKYDFNKPDLFIINSHFLMLNAVEICQHLKRNPNLKEVPVVIVSNILELETLAKHCGAAAFVEKPFITAQLLLKIKQILSS